MTMTPIKPYLLRALYEWIINNELTPYVVINADIEGVMVPNEYIEDGQIILNIAPDATNHLIIHDEQLECYASFGGLAQAIKVPMTAIKAIYAKENGQGMAFPEDNLDNPTPPSPTNPNEPSPIEPTKQPSRGKPNLKLVK